MSVAASGHDDLPAGTIFVEQDFLVRGDLRIPMGWSVYQATHQSDRSTFERICWCEREDRATEIAELLIEARTRQDSLEPPLPRTEEV